MDGRLDGACSRKTHSLTQQKYVPVHEFQPVTKVPNICSVLVCSIVQPQPSFIAIVLVQLKFLTLRLPGTHIKNNLLDIIILIPNITGKVENESVYDYHVVARRIDSRRLEIYPRCYRY